MPRPNWSYVKIDTSLPDNDKWDGCPLGTQLVAEATLSRALMYCREYLTDGKISTGRWRKIGNALGRRTLVDLKFVLETNDWVEIPHYLDYYPSRAKVEELTARRREWGREGGRKRPGAKQDAKHDAWPDAKPDAERRLKPKSESESKSKSDPPSPPGAAAAGPAAGSPPGVQPDDDSVDSEDLARVVMAEVYRATGAPIDHAAAESLIVLLLGDRQPRNPVAYVRAVIRGEERPRDRFLPKGQTGRQPPPHTRPRAYPAPDVARGGAQLARDLMQNTGDGAGDDPDEVPF